MCAKGSEPDKIVGRKVREVGVIISLTAGSDWCVCKQLHCCEPTLRTAGSGHEITLSLITAHGDQLQHSLPPLREVRGERGCPQGSLWYSGIPYTGHHH